MFSKNIILLLIAFVLTIYSLQPLYAAANLKKLKKRLSAKIRNLRDGLGVFYDSGKWILGTTPGSGCDTREPASRASMKR